LTAFVVLRGIPWNLVRFARVHLFAQFVDASRWRFLVSVAHPRGSCRDGEAVVVTYDGLAVDQA
jgi:hypothetical protein